MESVFSSMRLIRFLTISLCEPMNSTEQTLVAVAAGQQLGWCLERLGFIHTRTFPSCVKNIISSVMSKDPTFSYSSLKPSRQHWQRYSWSGRGMSLISLSLSSTFLAYSSPLQTVEQSSATEVLVKYLTLQIQGELRYGPLSALMSSILLGEGSSFLISTSLEQLQKSSWLRNCSSYSSISSSVSLLTSSRLRWGLTFGKSVWVGSSMAYIQLSKAMPSSCKAWEFLCPMGILLKIINQSPASHPHNIMSKNFEYNFTTENEIVELRERIAELEEENSLLKESLEELIKVNTELTESIEEFNNQNPNAEQQAEQMNQMAEAIQAQAQEIDALRQELERSRQNEAKTQKKLPSELATEQETESLVNVLEELIESFKHMQTRYQGEMQQFQRVFEEYKNSYEQELRRIREEYEQKLSTLEPIIMQLRRKDENLAAIEQRMTQLERGSRGSYQGQEAGRQSEENKRLKAELQLRERQIQSYKGTLERLKAKFNEKL